MFYRSGSYGMGDGIVKQNAIGIRGKGIVGAGI